MCSTVTNSNFFLVLRHRKSICIAAFFGYILFGQFDQNYVASFQNGFKNGFKIKFTELKQWYDAIIGILVYFTHEIPIPNISTIISNEEYVYTWNGLIENEIKYIELKLKDKIENEINCITFNLDEFYNLIKSIKQSFFLLLVLPQANNYFLNLYYLKKRTLYT